MKTTISLVICLIFMSCSSTEKLDSISKKEERQFHKRYVKEEKRLFKKYHDFYVVQDSLVKKFN